MLNTHRTKLMMVIVALYCGRAWGGTPKEQALEKAWKVVRYSGASAPVEFLGYAPSNWGTPIRLKGPINDPYAETEDDKGGDCYSFRFAERQGQKRNRMTVDINVKSGKIQYFFSSKQATIKNGEKLLSESDCRLKACLWMKGVGEPLSSDMRLYSSRLISGKQVFEWRRGMKSKAGVVMLPPYRNIKINRQTGDAISYGMLNFEVSLHSFEPKVSRTVAVGKSMERIRKDLNNPYKVYGDIFQGGDPGQLDDVFLGVWEVPAYQNRPATQNLVWEVRFNGRMKAMGRSKQGKMIAIWDSVHWNAIVDANLPVVMTVNASGPYTQRTLTHPMAKDPVPRVVKRTISASNKVTRPKN